MEILINLYCEINVMDALHVKTVQQMTGNATTWIADCNCVVTHQHCCSKIKFMEKLSNKDVYLKHISNILLLNIPENFNEPLKVAM